MRGKSKIGNRMEARTNQMLEGMREKRRQELEREFAKKKKEESMIRADMEFLESFGEQFDPVKSAVEYRTTKRAKKEEHDF